MLRDASPDLMGIDAKKAALSKMMPDRLKQYALENSDDLITMSLISQIQSARNKADLARKAQQANAQPPKVTQQLVDSIPAEESGIASLPAENMTYAAEGGIVGYAGDGPQGQLVMGDISGGEGTEAQYLDDIRVQNANRAKKISELEAQAKFLRSVGAPQAGQVEAELAQLTNVGLRQEQTTEPGRVQTASTRPGVAYQNPPQGSQRVLPQGAPQGTRQAAPQVAPQKDIYQQYQDILSKVGKPDVDPFAAERAEILKSRQEQAMREQTDAEQRAQGIQSLLRPREERITQREAALQKQGEIDKSMAIINAGLAMMQSTGGGLSGIAEGAAKGMKQYGESMSLSKAEQQKISDARDAYDEFKLNAQNMSQKEITAAKNKFASLADDMKEKAIAARQALHGENRADARMFLEATLKEQQERAANLNRLEAARIAAAAANRPGERERIMGRYLEIKATDPKAAEEFLKTYERTTGVAQRAETAAEKNDIARQKLLAGDQGFVYTGALKTMNDPKSTPEQKQKAQLTITSMEQAAGIQSSAPQAGTRIKFDAQGNPI